MPPSLGAKFSGEFADEVFAGDRLRAAIGVAHRADEAACVKALLRQADLGAAANARIAKILRRSVRPWTRVGTS